jgi:hypothetical protein
MRLFSSVAASSAGATVGVGFRAGNSGTHSSRTLMLSDRRALLAAVPPRAARHAYVAAVVEENCLRKPTASARRLSVQRLGELYARASGGVRVELDALPERLDVNCVKERRRDFLT